MSLERAQGVLALGEPPGQPDRAARERAVKDLGETLFVEAGAGTGKTGVLVARVVELVLTQSCELREIAAITFTEAAAGELRERIRSALFERLGYAEQPELIGGALDQLDEAAMTTIHGFAQRILTDFPLEAGLPLRFEVLDEIAADLAFSRRFSAFLDALFDEPEARSILAGAVLLGTTTAQIRSLSVSLAQSTDRARHARSALEGKIGAGLAASVEAHAGALRGKIEALAGFAPFCADSDDRLLARLIELAKQTELISASDDWLDRLSWISRLRPQRVGNYGRKQSWTEESVETVRAGFAAFEQARLAALDDLGALVIGALGFRLAEESLAWADERRVSGLLHFDDLLCLARDLIRSDRHVRAVLRQRYRRILVDEFQDTDPLQLEILQLLAGQDDEAAGSGRLFFVGDPRQSIYRFRGAGLASYDRARELFSGGDPIHLVTNYRSRPAIIAFVNAIFGQLMGESEAPEPAPSSPASAYVPLVADRAAHIGALPVVVLGGPKEQSASERRQLECEEIAATIASVVATGWRVEDGEQAREAGFSDIAILVPRRTGLSELEAALEARAIPYSVASSTLIYASQEVRDLLALLRAVDSPAEETAIVAALRTPALACSDEDLHRYRSQGGEWRLPVVGPVVGPVIGPGKDPDALDPVGQALGRLGSYHEKRQILGPLGILELMLSREKIPQLLSATARGPEALRRLYFLLERVRAFEQAGGVSLGELLEWLDLEAALGPRAVEPQLEEGDNVVRILTIHGAKGLEFPVVFLAELGASLRSPVREARVLAGEDGRIEIRARAGLETAGFGELSQSEADLELAEAVRLCYVGATRARDHLVLALHHQPATTASARSLAEQIFAVAKAQPEIWRVVPSSESAAGFVERGLTTGEEKILPGPAESEASYNATLTARASLLARLATPSSLAASGLDQEQAPGAPRSGDVEISAGLPSWWGQGAGDDALQVTRRAASGRGRAVHSVLQQVDLASPDDLSALARGAAEEEHCPEDSARIEQLARAALGAVVVRAGAVASRAYRELPVSALVGGGTLQCVIDLCYFENDELVVVDYKTDALPPNLSLEDHGSRYRLQAGAYALALEAVLGVRVGRVVLVFAAGEPDALEYELPDLPGAIAAARAELEERFSGLIVRS